MSRQRIVTVAGVLAIVAVMAPAAGAVGLVDQAQARRCGLTRDWFAQVGSAQSTGPVNHLHYADGVLLAQTTAGLLTAIEAETGRTLWAQQVGSRGRVSTEAAANKDYVAVTNGSTLYVLKRADGSLLWERRVVGAPGAGPAVSATHVFVAMIDGRIEGYALDGSTKFSPWVYHSAGDVQVPPLATTHLVSWTTERGHLCVADSQGGGARYRLETNDAIYARPGYWTPYLYAASTDGSVYAVDEFDGTLSWKYAIGDAIYEPPVPIGDRLFLVSQLRGLTCLDTKTTKEQWVAPGIKQFLSAGPARLYVIDSQDRLAVVDIHTGARVAATPLPDVSVKLTNTLSDRIFLASESGTVQCLREIGRDQPVLHVPPVAVRPKAKLRVREPSATPAEAPAADAEPDAAADAPAADAPMDNAPKGDTPAADDMPAEPEKPDADDPFATP
jgi:hypothetical protein